MLELKESECNFFIWIFSNVQDFFIRLYCSSENNFNKKYKNLFIGIFLLLFFVWNI